MKKWIWLIIVILVGGGGAMAYVYRDHIIAPKAVEHHAVFEVQRQDLLVSVTEGGNLEALNEVSIINEVQGQSQIITLVPEGTYVQEGDLLVELDSSDLEEKLVQQQITYQNALSSYTKAEEDRDIQKSRNESDIREAELALDFAKLDLEKYRDGDWPQEQKKAQSDITIAEAELKRAQDRLTWTEKLQEQGYATRAELDADKLDVKRKELQLAQAQEKLRLLEKYEYPQKVRKLEAELLKKGEELQRVRVRAASAMAQAIAEVKSRGATRDLQKDKLDNLEEQLAKTRIFAPQAGLVIYASSVGGRRNSTQIVEGAMVRQRHELIKLPDVSQMKVQVKIHESRMNQVNQGQRAYVVVDAMPDRRFAGYVSKVSVLPDSQSRWLNPDLKVYSTDIVIEDQLPAEIKPGLSARGEIIIQKLEDVLVVPIQSVTSQGEQQLVHRVVEGQVVPTPVSIGMFNDAYIQITEGIATGDIVLLNPPMMEDMNELAGQVVEEEDVNEADATLDETADPAEDATAGSRDASLEQLLAKVPEERRAQLRERWQGMSLEERQEFAQQLKQRQQEASAP